jgi:hypothetical protein
MKLNIFLRENFKSFEAHIRVMFFAPNIKTFQFWGHGLLECLKNDHLGIIVGSNIF